MSIWIWLYQESEVQIFGLDYSRKRGYRWGHQQPNKGMIAKMEECLKVLCDKRILLRLKGRIYCTVVRSTLLYGAQCWPIKTYHAQRMRVAETRMLCWMCGHTWLDRIRNEVIRDKVGVTHRGLCVHYWGYVRGLFFRSVEEAEIDLKGVGTKWLDVVWGL